MNARQKERPGAGEQTRQFSNESSRVSQNGSSPSNASAYLRLDVTQLEQVPTELRCGQRFVCWREAVRDGRPTKIPLNPHNGREAESDNPETWGTMEQSLRFFEAQRGTVHGIGRMFHVDDGIMGLDFDDCLDEQGKLIPDTPAAEWLPKVNSYTEVSPSGRGVKVFVRARHELGGKSGRRNAKHGVEIYGAKRYFTITGKRLQAYAAAVEDRQEEIGDFVAAFFGTARSIHPHVQPITALSDEEIIARASRAENGLKFQALWNGNMDGHGSQSEADAALSAMLWWWTGDRELVRRLVGKSALGKREKWQNRADYQDATLDFACQGETLACAKEVDAYFDTGRKEYWTANNRGGWINLNETQFKRILRQSGVSPVVSKGSYVSPLDEKLIDTQQRHDVHYAGALAGHRSGPCDAGERRILVTESPRIIEPRAGQCQTIHAVTDGLLCEAQVNQLPYLFGWLKIAFEALQAGRHRPGQAVAIAGPHNCGKSLLQKLITLILGGRSARPYQFMSGLTPFNSDLFEAEHLMIEDEQASTDIRARRNFGAQLKNFTVVETQRCHAKNRVPITLNPFWRLTITVNDEPENLMVLPPIDDSIEDKLIILRASKMPMPMPTSTREQRELFWQTLVGELPAFLHFLTHWEIPSALSSERFGITHFHHPEILQAIDILAPEFRLLRLIDDELFQSDAAGAWEGTAEALERQLSADVSGCRHEARKLFTFNTACGVYLGRLAKRHPERFSPKHTRQGNQWTITPCVR